MCAYLFQLTKCFKPHSNCFNSTELSCFVEITTGTLKSKLAIGSSRVLPKLLKYFFSSTVIVTLLKIFLSLVVLMTVFPVNFSVHLNDSESVIVSLSAAS